MTNTLLFLKKKLIFVLMLSMSNAFAANDLLVITHGYGDVSWSEKENFNSPVIYPLNQSKQYFQGLDKKHHATRDIYHYYVLSDFENKKTQISHKLNVSLSVRQDKSKVFSKVTFYNRSNQDYFIFRGQLPSEESNYSEMCGDSFLITSGNIKLDYLGRRCQFGNERFSDRNSSWKRIKAGEKYAFSAILNRAYEFLPGEHQYTIGSLEYSVVMDEWFTENNNNRMMFAIFNLISSCPIITEKPLVVQKRWLCPQYIGSDHDLRYILRHIGIDNNKSSHNFVLRTNEVVTTINVAGDASYYQFLK